MTYVKHTITKYVCNGKPMFDVDCCFKELTSDQLNRLLELENDFLREGEE